MSQVWTGLAVVTLKCLTSAAAAAGLMLSGMPMTGVSPMPFMAVTHASPLSDRSQPVAEHVTELCGSLAVASVSQMRE
jgi:hypothetical protein